MIELRQLSVAYGERQVVHEVDLQIPNHGITALIGPNGAGKSTLLCAVGRLLPRCAGELLIDDIPLEKWRTDALARKLAILRQENHLNMRLTVAELVMLGRHPHNKGRSSTRDYEVVAEALEQVELTDLSSRFLDELSGGQRQRAFVAMTLAQEAHYLLLDEPLSALDMRHARELMRRLARTSKEQNISVVIVIHDVNTAAAYADHIVALKDGRVVATGTPHEVLTPETMHQVFDIEVQVIEVEGAPVVIPKR